MEKIFRVGKINSKYKFEYIRSLKELKNNEDSEENFNNHSNIVKLIESDMDDKILKLAKDYHINNWYFMIDDNCIFWIMNEQYMNLYYK